MVRKNKKDRTVHKYFGLLMILILGCIVGYSVKQCKTCEVYPTGEYERGVYEAIDTIFETVERWEYVTLRLNNETMYLVPVSTDPIENSHIVFEDVNKE